jgi:hypothetical protein
MEGCTADCGRRPCRSPLQADYNACFLLQAHTGHFEGGPSISGITSGLQSRKPQSRAGASTEVIVIRCRDNGPPTKQQHCNRRRHTECPTAARLAQQATNDSSSPVTHTVTDWQPVSHLGLTILQPWLNGGSPNGGGSVGHPRTRSCGTESHYGYAYYDAGRVRPRGQHTLAIRATTSSTVCSILGRPPPTASSHGCVSHPLVLTVICTHGHRQRGKLCRRPVFMPLPPWFAVEHSDADCIAPKCATGVGTNQLSRHKSNR